MDMTSWFVVIMGISTVFIGLICIVVLCKIVGFFCRGKGNDDVKAPAPAVAPTSANAPIQNRREVIAAVSAVLAEEMGCDVSAIRIHSFKKI